MRDDFKGWGKEDVTLEQHAYYEAGHAVMYFLLSTGRAIEFTPIGRGRMLPPFPSIKSMPHGMEWGELTGNLGSMMTAAQVLLAGWIALNVKLGGENKLDMKAIRIKRAHHLIGAYAEEYVSDTDFKKRDRAADEWLNQMHMSVTHHIETNWRAVEALAQNILSEQRDLSEVEAFEMIEAALEG